MYINLQANRRDVVNNVDGRIKRKEKKNIRTNRTQRDDSYRKLSCVSKLTYVLLLKCREDIYICVCVHIGNDLSCLADHVKVQDHLREERKREEKRTSVCV